ncbi:MAG: PLP-dependent aminotransferase family protein [Deltaproteobacteria bacterium]|nr:MAG: PLP-dependent aminotransferase family protein [Deltaproteobacteria bacterium]
MDIPIQRGDGGSAPIYLQIADYLRAEMEAGRLRSGTRLPTIRRLASELAVNRGTVSLAYEELAARGLVTSTVGRGTFVRAPAAAEPVTPDAPGAFQPVFTAPVERLIDLENARPRYAADGDAIAFHALVPDPSLYPADAFRRALNRVLASEGAELLSYGGPQGHRGLREALAKRFAAAGMRHSADEIVLCQGASQGIALAMRLFAERGDVVAVEEPTYSNVLSAIASLGLKTAPVPMRETGLDLAALEHTLARPDVKLLYTIPTFHNPLGTSTSVEHREALLACAGRHGKPVVEDAYEMDLAYSGRALPPLAALDAAGLVVHLFSFSKSLFPGARVGSIAARGRLIDALLAMRNATDLGGALVLQAALSQFVADGDYDRHLARLRRTLRSRRDAMLAALRRHFPDGARWSEPSGGYQIWVELPEGLDSRDLLEDAQAAGVLFAPGFLFHHDGRPSRGLRLTIATADEAAIERGVAKLGERIHARLAAGPPPRRAAVPV